MAVVLFGSRAEGSCLRTTMFGSRSLAIEVASITDVRVEGDLGDRGHTVLAIHFDPSKVVAFLRMASELVDGCFMPGWAAWLRRRE